MRPSPSSRVDPGLPVVAQAPSDAGRAGLHAQEVAAAQRAPVHLRGWHDHRLGVVADGLDLRLPADPEVGHVLGVHAVVEAAVVKTVQGDLLKKGF